jgi:hypothetical protein
MGCKKPICIPCRRVHATDRSECKGSRVRDIPPDYPGIWCPNDRYGFTNTCNVPFKSCTLTPGEIVIAFVLYADTLLSIRQIALPRAATASLGTTSEVSE